MQPLDLQLVLLPFECITPAINKVDVKLMQLV